MPPQSGAIKVTDRLERRIRKPVDLLRCVITTIEIIVLALVGGAASATTTGIETDIIGASARLPHALRVVAPTVAPFAILQRAGEIVGLPVCAAWWAAARVRSRERLAVSGLAGSGGWTG